MPKYFVLPHQQLEAELHNSRQQLSSLQSHCSDLEDQISSKEREAAVKDAQLSQLRYGENVTLESLFSLSRYLPTAYMCIYILEQNVCSIVRLSTL